MDKALENQNFVLKVKKQEINEFYYRVTWNNIRTFLGNMIAHMSNDMKKEVREKRSDLILIDEEKGIYQFVTQNGSEELNNYMKKYLIISE